MKSAAPDARVSLVWALAEAPELAKDMKQPGATWLFGETTRDVELHAALKGYRKALNAFVKGPYSKLSEDAQWLARNAVIPYELSYYWCAYDIRLRRFFWPYCEPWAIDAVQSESSLHGSLVRALEADLVICTLLEEVGDRANGYKRFGEVFLQRFNATIAGLRMDPDPSLPVVREHGRDLSQALARYKKWLQRPEQYPEFMPDGNDPIDSMRREAQYLTQQRYKKEADFKWLVPWLKAWGAYCRVLGRGVGIKRIQLQGDELVRLHDGTFKRYRPPHS